MASTLVMPTICYTSVYVTTCIQEFRGHGGKLAFRGLRSGIKTTAKNVLAFWLYLFLAGAMIWGYVLYTPIFTSAFYQHRRVVLYLTRSLKIVFSRSITNNVITVQVGNPKSFLQLRTANIISSYSVERLWATETKLTAKHMTRLP